jgi:hypothetical protein
MVPNHDTIHIGYGIVGTGWQNAGLNSKIADPFTFL